MGRTMTDLITLDSILRSSNMTSTAVGSIPDPVACNAFIDPNITLKGLRLGLPSNFGWVNPGLSSQVSLLPCHDVYTPKKGWEGLRVRSQQQTSFQLLCTRGLTEGRNYRLGLALSLSLRPSHNC